MSSSFMKKTNVNTALAIFFIAIMLMIGLGTTTGPITLQKAFAQLRGSDRCVSDQALDGDSTSSTCIAASDRKVVNEEIKSLQESCKDAKEQGLVDKCSGSQTGFGEFCNWVRVHKDAFIANFGYEPPCNDIVKK
jgi:hypothetical protein